jgi:outer membrane protein
MIPGILALLLTGILFYLVYHPHPAAANHGAVPPSGSQPAATPFRIAYFDLDSLEAHYEYFKDVFAQSKQRENEMNAELGSIEKGYQKKIAEWQKKGSSMSQAESEQAQQEYAMMQQNYQVKKQSLQETLFKHNEDLKSDIRKKIEEYLKDYNRQKNFTYIFAYESNSFVYTKDTSYDITADLIEGLNASYQKKK